MSNIFRRKKSFKRPAAKAAQAPKKTVAPTPVAPATSPTPPKGKSKGIIRRRKKDPVVVEETASLATPQAEQPVEVSSPKPEAEVLSAPEQPVVTEATPVELVNVESVEAPAPVIETDVEPLAAQPQAPAPSAEPDTVKEESTKQSASPDVTTDSKTQTEKQETPNKAFSKLGKAVIMPPPNYSATGRTTTPPKTTTPSESKEKTWKTKTPENSTRSTREDKAGKNVKKQRRRSKDRDRIQRQRVEMRMDDLPTPSSRRRRGRGKSSVQRKSPKAKAIKRRVFMDTKITVGALAHNMSVKASDLIKKLVQQGQIVTMNDDLDFETAQLIATDFEYEVINTAFQEEKFLIQEKPKTGGASRPAVITIMGHVDHGKTTLLDTIRRSKVVDGEAGGITQHISAYQVERDGQLLTFIDTPGHEAFTAMRARGAQVTDIVVLVVAADDGVMPQTLEALSHAKAAGVQIMVAVNKCDRPSANPMHVRQQLMQHELVPEEFGGETIFVDVSALKGEGIDDLLDSLILIAEMGEYTAPDKQHAEGTVLEARLEKGRGPVATVIIKSGTLARGDSLVVGQVWGRVRAMNDFKGKPLKKAGPSTPVELIGLQAVPLAGEDFTVVKNDKHARTLAEHRQADSRNQNQSKPKKLTLEDLLSMQDQAEKISLNLIVKTDVGGTLEALKASLEKIDVPGTELKILHSGVGAVTEGDISLAHTYEGIVLGFNVRPDGKARKAMNEYNIEVRTYKIIYEALEDIEKALKGLLSPETKEQTKGLAEIRKTFSVPKVGTVAGCYVLDGKISRNHKVRLLRNSIVIWEGRLASLQRFKDSVREVEKGYECGMNLDGFNDIKAGDQIETYMIEEVERSD